MELVSLVWGDVVLDKAKPFVMVKASNSKNKRAQAVPLMSELVERLMAWRSIDCVLTDRVFPKGVPRARTLVKDLAKAGIPYQDASGRFADFHSLRYTWATFLQRNKVSQRVAMNLMRHSNVDMTSKVYTDENLLPIAREVEALSRLFDEGCTQKRTQISVSEGQNESQADAADRESNLSEAALADAFRRLLTRFGGLGKMVEVAEIEPSFTVPKFASIFI